jgi:sec-independent protein translocase protein TatA
LHHHSLIFNVEVKAKEGISVKVGWTELLVVLIIVLVIFGGGKLAGVGSALGRTIKEFKKEVKDGDASDPAKADASSDESSAN